MNAVQENLANGLQSENVIVFIHLSLKQSTRKQWPAFSLHLFRIKTSCNQASILQPLIFAAIA